MKLASVPVSLLCLCLSNSIYWEVRWEGSSWTARVIPGLGVCVGSNAPSFTANTQYGIFPSLSSLKISVSAFLVTQ